MSAAQRWYRVMLHCYPRDFRGRFGAEMCETFALASRQPQGVAGRLRFLLRATADLLQSAAVEHRHQSHKHRDRTPRFQEMTMRSLGQDVGYALRSLRRRPGFVAIVALTLALGVGANTAIFSLINAVLLHPLPIAHPERVVRVYQARTQRALEGAFTYPDFRALQQAAPSFSGIAGWTTDAVGFRGGDYADELTTSNVSGNYFSLLDIHPAAGRLLTPSDDDAPHGHAVAVLSDALWARAFNRSPAAIGSTVYLGGNPFMVIGVTVPGFRGTDLGTPADLWVPITMTTSTGSGSLFSGPFADQVFTTPAFRWVDVIGRLDVSATPPSTTAQLNLWHSRIHPAATAADPARSSVVARPMSIRPIVDAAAMGDRSNLVHFVAMLIVVVVLTLLLACANVANLLMIRSAERGHEFRVRTALGAGRGRLIRHLLLESMVLAFLGAVAGVVVGAAMMRLLATFTLPGHVDLSQVGLGLNRWVLGFTTVVALITALLFGTMPALRASRVDSNELLGSHRGVSRRSGSGLLAIQIAISLLLLVGAGLFTRSVRNALHTDLGFDPSRLVAVSTNLMRYGYDRTRAMQYYNDAIDRARHLPGVTHVAVAEQIPLGTMLTLPFDGIVTGDAPPDPAKAVSAGMNPVSPDYFAMLGLSPIEGRLLQESDDATAPKVAVLNQSAARLFSPHGSAVGKTITLFGTVHYIVVGVVPDTRYESVSDHDVAVVFPSMTQERMSGGVSLVVASRNPVATLAALRPAMHQIDPTVALLNPRLVARQIDDTLLPQRMGAALIGMFSLLAMFIAAIGIYSVAMFGVTQRVREIGIRMALGAQRQRIIRLVMRQVGVAATIGITIGIAAAIAAGRTVARFLYGVAPVDPATLATAIAVIALVTVVAGWLPARRALRVDPATSMRAE
jgi:predicted permease